MKAEKIHSGQYRPYGDSHDVWMVEADWIGNTYEDVMAWCRENILGGSTIPVRAEFYRKWKEDNTFTMNDFFKGYVTLYNRKGKVWRFEKVSPYTD